MEEPDCYYATQDADCVEATLNTARRNCAVQKHEHSVLYTSVVVKINRLKATADTLPDSPARTARLSALNGIKDTAKSLYDAAIGVYEDAVLTYDEALEALDAARAMGPCSQVKIDALNAAIAMMHTAAHRIGDAHTYFVMNASSFQGMQSDLDALEGI